MEQASSIPVQLVQRGALVIFFLQIACHNQIQATPEGAKQGEHFWLGMISWGAMIEADAIVTGLTFEDWPNFY